MAKPVLPECFPDKGFRGQAYRASIKATWIPAKLVPGRSNRGSIRERQL